MKRVVKEIPDVILSSQITNKNANLLLSVDLFLNKGQLSLGLYAPHCKNNIWQMVSLVDSSPLATKKTASCTEFAEYRLFNDMLKDLSELNDRVVCNHCNLLVVADNRYERVKLVQSLSLISYRLEDHVNKTPELNKPELQMIETLIAGSHKDVKAVLENILVSNRSCK